MGGRREGRVDGPSAIGFLQLWEWEQFEEDGGGVNEVHCLRREDMAFLRRGHSVFGGRVEEADMLEIRFRL